MFLDRVGYVLYRVGYVLYRVGYVFLEVYWDTWGVWGLPIIYSV